jgi:hypothetical protein
MDLLLITGSHAAFYFVRCTKVTVDLFADQDWFYGCISEDNSGCEEAVNDSNYDLPWLNTDVNNILRTSKGRIASYKLFWYREPRKHRSAAGPLV